MVMEGVRAVEETPVNRGRTESGGASCRDVQVGVVSIN